MHRPGGDGNMFGEPFSSRGNRGPNGFLASLTRVSLDRFAGCSAEVKFLQVKGTEAQLTSVQ